MTVSALVRRVIAAHLKHQRAKLPHARGPSHQALRELCRIGNNLNQLSRQANAGMVPLTNTELEHCLKRVLDVVDQLA